MPELHPLSYLILLLGLQTVCSKPGFKVMSYQSYMLSESRTSSSSCQPLDFPDFHRSISPRRGNLALILDP